ncbi:hypothetical protein EJB05_15839, partial [Eragrostis curvula]
MRNPCRRAGGLDTVHEIPVPDFHHEPPPCCGSRRRSRSRTVKAWVRSHFVRFRRRRDGAPPSPSDLQLMIRVIGAPMVMRPAEPWTTGLAGRDIGELPLAVSKAKYVVEQYVAAAGGRAALRPASSMCAVGSVRMRTTSRRGGKDKVAAGGGFVVWQQKSPAGWCVEMVVSGSGGCKMSAGSDGAVAWRQAPWQPAGAAPGPPRPLRRCVQGLDPTSTADLFSGAAWAGEKRVDGDDCFVLRVDAAASELRARSGGAGAEVVRHAMWGYFSQRTGLLVGLEDRHLVRLSRGAGGGDCWWETSMASSIGDYRRVDGVSVAHAGRTVATLARSGGGGGGWTRRTRTCVEETWSIQEVGFNVAGLSTECFLPPSDMVVACDTRSERLEKERVVVHRINAAAASSPTKITVGSSFNVAPADEVNKGEIVDAIVRPEVAAKNKVHVPAASTRLGWLGFVKIAAVGTVDAAENLKEGTAI